MRVLRSLLAIAILVGPLGCGALDSSDHPTLIEVAEQYGLAYCKKLRVCMGADFDLSYPGGVEDCAMRTFRIYGTSERSICPQERWDTCTTDLQSVQNTCVKSESGTMRPKLPDSCMDC